MESRGNALIFYGGWDGHEPEAVAKRFQKMLEKHGYHCEVCEGQDMLSDRERLMQMDLIVPCFTMGEIKAEYCYNIRYAVAAGCGIAGCHGGMCDAFRQDVEWQFMTGGQWVSHPGGDGVDYTVNIVKGSGPIVEGLSDFAVCSEQYYLHVDPAVEVLATTRFPVVDGCHTSNKPVDMPVAWTKFWGNGRVFYCSLGHHDDVFEKSPSAAVLMERGLIWFRGGHFMENIKIGVLGVGAISGIYLQNLTRLFSGVCVEAVCDIVLEKAKKAAEEYGIPKVYGRFEEMFADPETEIILNLTRPLEHYSTTKAALMAGKNVYTEKPLAGTYEEGVELLELSDSRGLLLGGAPDTFMGAGIQTCRKLIDDGLIGKVIGAEARMVCHGHEGWHPAPEFYYQVGGGPMMDMGPYYMTALINLIGRVTGISGMVGKGFEQRVITSEPKKGEVIPVCVPTHTAGLMKFENGAIATVLTTFDVHYDRQASLEIYGTKGSLRVPDPNCFGGSVWLLRPEDGSFKEMPLLFDYKENSRGIGVADMAKALREKSSFRADAQQTLHVLEIMTTFEKSSKEGCYIELKSPYKRHRAMENLPVSGVL